MLPVFKSLSNGTFKIGYNVFQLPVDQFRFLKDESRTGDSPVPMVLTGRVGQGLSLFLRRLPAWEGPHVWAPGKGQDNNTRWTEPDDDGVFQSLTSNFKTCSLKIHIQI